MPQQLSGLVEYVVSDVSKKPVVFEVLLFTSTVGQDQGCMSLRNVANNLCGEANLHAQEWKSLKTMLLRKFLKFHIWTQQCFLSWTALCNKSVLFSTMIGVPWIEHQISLSFNTPEEKRRCPCLFSTPFHSPMILQLFGYLPCDETHLEHATYWQSEIVLAC